LCIYTNGAIHLNLAPSGTKWPHEKFVDDGKTPEGLWPTETVATPVMRIGASQLARIAAVTARCNTSGPWTPAKFEASDAAGLKGVLVTIGENVSIVQMPVKA
jgi:hypothetical protein